MIEPLTPEAAELLESCKRRPLSEGAGHLDERRREPGPNVIRGLEYPVEPERRDAWRNARG